MIEKLKRKYGGTIEKVIETGKSLRKELDNIEFSTQNIEKLESKIFNVRNNLLNKAKEISNTRKIYAEKLSGLIVEKLEKLDYQKCGLK